MSQRESNTWLQLSGDDDIYVHDSGQLARITGELASPNTTYPSLTLFMGRKSMQQALRQHYTSNNFKRGPEQSLVNLRIDSSTVSSEVPSLFADTDPTRILCTEQPGPSIRHPERVRSINWLQTPETSIRDTIYARLLFLFSDVICIFADDCGGIERVADILKIWATAGSASTFPKAARPRVVVVTAESYASATYELLEIEELRHRLREQDSEIQNQCYSSVKLVHLSGNHVSALARHRRLKEIPLNERDEARATREEHGALFSATHFNQFFRDAVDHTTRTTTEPFDFVRVSRSSNPVPEHTSNHIWEFVSVSGGISVSHFSVFDHIASCIAMDAFPPGMHGR